VRRSRSGSTLFRLILDAHPRLAVPLVLAQMSVKIDYGGKG